MAHRMPHSIVCKICGGKFMKSSYPIHVPRCQKKWDASHTKCDRCGRDISNDDWALHRGDCKVDPEYQKRVKAAAAAQKRAEKQAKQAAELKASQEKKRQEMLEAGQEPVPAGMCMECVEQQATFHCKECEEDMCADCDAQIHSRGARVRHQRDEILAPVEEKKGGGMGDEFPPEEDQVDREACNICGRKFAKDRVYVHERICKKNANKKPKKPKTGTQIRTKGTEYEQFVKKRPKTPPEVKQWREQGGRRWKSELEGFRGLLDANRMARSGNLDSGDFEEKKSGPPPSKQRTNAAANASSSSATSKAGPSSSSASANRTTTQKSSAGTRSTSSNAPANAGKSKNSNSSSNSQDNMEAKRQLLLQSTPDPEQLRQQLDEFQAVLPPKARERKTEARDRNREVQAAAAAEMAATSSSSPPPYTSGAANNASASRRAPSSTSAAAATAAARRASGSRGATGSGPGSGAGVRASGSSSSVRSGGSGSARSVRSTGSAGSANSQRTRSIGRVGQRTQQVKGPLFTKGNDASGSYTTKSGGVRSQYTDRKVARERAEAAMKAMRAEKRGSAGSSSKRASSVGSRGGSRGALPRSGSTGSSRGSRSSLLASHRTGSRNSMSGGAAGASVGGRPGSGSSSSSLRGSAAAVGGGGGTSTRKSNSNAASAAPPLMGAAQLRASTRAQTPERRTTTPEYVPATNTASSGTASGPTAVNLPAASSNLSMQEYLARERLRRQQSKGRSFDAVRAGAGAASSGGPVRAGGRSVAPAPAPAPVPAAAPAPVRSQPPASSPAPAPAPVAEPAFAPADNTSTAAAASNRGAGGGVAIDIPVGKAKGAMPLLSNPRDRAKGTSKEPRPGPVGTGLILSGPKGRTPVNRMMQAKMVDGKVQRVLVADPQKAAALKKGQQATAAPASSNSREDIRAARAAYFDRVLSKE